MPHPGAPTVIHFHGNGEVVSDYVPDMAEEYANLGVNVLFAEYRGYGASTGAQPALERMLDDAAAILAASGEPTENVILFGRSIGSLFAIELAGQHPNLRGLILESGIADPLTLFRIAPEQLGVSQAELAAAIASRLDHRAKLGRYGGPLLILHAAGDRLVSPSHAERNFAWCATAPGEKELLLLSRGNHSTIFLSNYAEYTWALRRFFARLGVRAPVAGVVSVMQSKINSAGRFSREIANKAARSDSRSGGRFAGDNDGKPSDHVRDGACARGNRRYVLAALRPRRRSARFSSTRRRFIDRCGDGIFAVRPLAGGTVCETDELVLFACAAKGSGKSVALCADTVEEIGIRSIRFGRRGSVEIEFPADRDKIQQQFRYSHYGRVQVDRTLSASLAMVIDIRCLQTTRRTLRPR